VIGSQTLHTPSVDLTADYSWDFTNSRPNSISLEIGTNTVASFTYQYETNSDRIDRMTLSDGSYWVYSYDVKGQLISGCRYFANGTPYPGFQFGYEYDEIGNVVKACHRGRISTSDK